MGANMCNMKFTPSRTSCSDTDTSLFGTLSALSGELISEGCLFKDRVALSSLFLVPALIHFRTICRIRFGTGCGSVDGCRGLCHCVLSLISVPDVQRAVSVSCVGHRCCFSRERVGPAKVVPAKPRVP